MSEGIQDLDSAFASAWSESDEVQSGDSEATEPVAELDDIVADSEQADGEAGDQPEVAETADTDEDDMASLMEDMLQDKDEADSEDEKSEAAGAVTLESTIVVDIGEGAREYTIKDLVDGGLRQADYTRKTQEVAALRKDAEDAISFKDAFNEDPVGFTRALAERAGLIQPGQQPARDVKAAKFQTQEEFEAAVNAEVEKRIVESPEFVTAQAAAAKVALDAEFDRIGEAHGVEIPTELRSKIVDEAIARGTADIELVFEARMMRAKAARAADKRRTSTARPKASPPTARQGDAPKVVDSVEAAFEEALLEVGAA